MAKSAKRLVAAQGLEGTIEVIQGVIESVDIPEQVDIIISEWMVSRSLGSAVGWLGVGAFCTRVLVCVATVSSRSWMLLAAGQQG